MTEDDVVAACDALAAGCRWEVCDYSDKRRVRTTPGLPDRRYVKPGRYVLWVEAKAPKGKLTAEQHAWLLAELDAGGLATCIDDAAQLLALFKTLGRGGSIAKSQAATTCRALVELCAARGFRKAA